MNSLLILIPVTLLIVLLAAAIFFWAVNHQQFDDLDSPGFVPLLDDPPQDYAGPSAGRPGARQANSPPSAAGRPDGPDNGSTIASSRAASPASGLRPPNPRL